MIRPLGDVLLVRLEPESGDGPIVRVTPARMRTGIVESVGPGRKTARGDRAAPDVSAGDRVAFFREHMDTRQGRALAAHLDEDRVLLRAADVLFAIDGDVEVRA